MKKKQVYYNVPINTWYEDEGHTILADGCYKDGDVICYFVNGKSHREDGPSDIWDNGDVSWNLNGNNHREDGPAVEDNAGYKGWWLNGILLYETGNNRLHLCPSNISEEFKKSIIKYRLLE
jgi:hypothetical protein